MYLNRMCRMPVAFLFLATTVAACAKDSPTVPTLPKVEPGTVLLQDELDEENGGVGKGNYKNFATWNVVDGCVDLHGNGFFDVQPGNGLYIDLDGTCDKAGTVETKAAYDLEPGTYVLEFWLAGNQQKDTPDSVVVSLGEVFREEIRLNRNEQFKLFTREITVNQPTSAKIRFAHAGADRQGILLDLLRLRRK
jgi:hypothetical protein